MENNEYKKYVMETCREYYNNLDRSKMDQITPERGKQIFEFADTYRGMHERKEFYKTVDLRFESAVQKLISAKDDVISLVSYTVVEDNDNMHHQQVSKYIRLENDAERILFIIRSIDPTNKLLETWNGIVQRFTTDTNSFLMSAHNYSKAKKIMLEYFNGFFDIKLVADEQSYLNYITTLTEDILESGLKK